MAEQNINIHQFLALCDPHRSIIHSFGIDPACTKTSAICRRGCQENQHKVANFKHQFIPAKQLYAKLQFVREQYRDFSNKFNTTYLTSFIQQVKDSLDKFAFYITQQYSETHPLIENFCRFNNFYSQNLFQIIQQKLDDIELSELKCKEVNSLKNLSDFIEKEDPKQRQHRVYQQYRYLLEYYLRKEKFLQSPKSTEAKNKSPEYTNCLCSIIEVEKLDDLSMRLEKSSSNYSIAKISDNRLIEELIIYIHEDFATIFETHKTNPMVFPNLNANLDTLMEHLNSYIIVIQPISIIFSINSNTDQNLFWQKLFKVLSTKKIVKYLKIITSKQIKDEYISKIAELYHSSYLQTVVETGINWQSHGISSASSWKPIQTEQSSVKKQANQLP